MYSVPPIQWRPLRNVPARSMMKRVWNSSSPLACQENISALSIHRPAVIKRLPRSQKNRRFCGPYCRQYKGIQAITHTVQRTLIQRGMRMTTYCMRGIVPFGTQPQKARLASPMRPKRNYYRNLMRLTGVPTMKSIWVTKHCFSVPMKRRLAP
jgi:hypothetical protein